MLNFSDARKPNVTISAVGSFVPFLGSVIVGAAILSKWGNNSSVEFVTYTCFGIANVFAIMMSLYALITVFSNGWILTTTRLSRAVLGTALWILLFWVLMLCRLLRTVFL